MGRYTLIITEKPNAAQRIASALNEEGKMKKMEDKGVPYYIAKRDKEIVVVPALGHLYTVAEERKGRNYYPVFNFRWVPRYAAERGAKQIRTWIETITKLASNADNFIDACVTPDTLVLTNPKEILTIGDLEGKWKEKEVIGFDEQHKKLITCKIERYKNLSSKKSERKVIKLVTESGRKICATEDHRFYGLQCWIPLDYIKPGDLVAVFPLKDRNANEGYREEEILVTESDLWNTLNRLLTEKSKKPYSKYRYTQQQYINTINLRKRGFTYKEISRRTKLSLRTVIRWLSEGKMPYTVRNPAIEELKQKKLLPLTTKNEKIGAVTRLLGAVFGDGCLYGSTKRWYARGAVFSCEISGGDEEVKRDLELLGFRYVTERRHRKGIINGRKFDQRSIIITCNSLALWLLLHSLGAPSGKKADIPYMIPKWLLHAPKHLQQEFLSSFFGGDLTMPRISSAHPKSFSQAELRFNKIENLKENGLQFANQIAKMLKRLDVKVSSIKAIPSGVVRKDKLKTVTIRIRISNSTESLRKLLQQIGISYCNRKERFAMLAGEYLRIKEKIGARKLLPFKIWRKSVTSGLRKSGLIWERVKSLEVCDFDDVRDITVSPTHNFIANGFLVHNCDYDIEGSIIGYCILKYACGNKENVSKRMKYSTLTKEELEKSYAELLPHLDFALIEAGGTRHEVDWLYGVNLSRALTISARNWSGKYATLSTGRVQGPTLKFLVAREKAIRSFVPTPYWEIKAEVEINRSVFEAEYERGKIEIKSEADAVLNACKGKNGQVDKIDVRRFQQKPPVPFDLGALQSEAYGLFGYTPRRTSNIAQRLYLEALISYPRTSSQKLPPEINYEAILKKLSKVPKYKKLVKKLLTKPELKPREGKKKDPAHPAIYPTGKLPERVSDDSEKKVWDLIVRRFMAVFSEPAIKQSMKVHINDNGHHFYLRGRQTLKEGWLYFYGPYVRSEEILLPPIEEGQTIKIKKVIIEDNFTKPPPRYNPGSVLKKMEETGIGTKATRANIIQTLYDRKYVRDERIVVTDLGFEVLEVLEKYCPAVVSIKLTSELEERMDKIQAKKEKRENVLVDAVEILKPVVQELKKKEKVIGKQLSQAIKRSSLEERIIGNCPVCGTGKLMILYSRKTGKRFIGCTNYFKGKCDTSFPLPQRGSVRPLGRNCRECGWPTVQVWIKGKRPWTLCFNPDCPLKKERKRRIEMRSMQ